MKTPVFVSVVSLTMTRGYGDFIGNLRVLYWEEPGAIFNRRALHSFLPLTRALALSRRAGRIGSHGNDLPP